MKGEGKGREDRREKKEAEGEGERREEKKIVLNIFHFREI